MNIVPVYQEIIDFIEAGTTPQNLVDFSLRRCKGTNCGSHP